MEGFSPHNASLIGRKNQAKFGNDCISRSGHRFKITQPNLLILISFSFVEDALSNDVKNNDTFFGHPVYVLIQVYYNSIRELNMSHADLEQIGL